MLPLVSRSCSSDGTSGASEVADVRALGSLDAGPHRSGDVAAAMEMQSSQVAAFRERPIGEGVVFAPRYGWVEYAIAHFVRYVRRAFRT